MKETCEGLKNNDFAFFLWLKSVNATLLLWYRFCNSLSFDHSLFSLAGSG